MKRAQIKELFERYGPMVYRRARQILGGHEEAEEATQEVFLKALRTDSSFRGKSRASTWLYSITTNYCLNVIRNRKRRQELWDQHKVDEEWQPARVGANPQAIVLMQLLLSEAPDDRWAAAAVYVYVDGMSHQEAAKVLGVSKRTVGNLLERFGSWARERLMGSESEAEAGAERKK